MKKFFAFAIAAVTMTVGCQKIQDIVNPDNAQVDETDLVEIKFSTNIATVETKSVSTLTGLNLQVYGINNTNTGKREFYDVATAGAEDAGKVELTLTNGPYYYNGNNDLYSFYGYYLDGATVTGTELSATNYTTTVTINGKNDILLAEGDDNGNYCGKEARNGNNPHLTFKHALSQLKFSAVNLGSEDIELTAVTVKTDNTGEVTVAGATPAATATASLTDFALDMQALSLSPLGNDTPVDDDYEKVIDASSNESELIVFPGASDCTLYFTLTQGTDTREFEYKLTQALDAGNSYQLKLKLYSLEQIEITASLTAWDVQSIEIDADDATEL